MPWDIIHVISLESRYVLSGFEATYIIGSSYLTRSWLMKSLSSKGSHDVNFIGYFTVGNTRKPLSLRVCVRVKREGMWVCVRREGVCKEGV